jgi:CRP-like cAMP-binding protein
MANKSPQIRVDNRPNGTSSGSDGHRSIHNSILLDLPRKERDEVLSKAEFVHLPVRAILNEMSEPIKFCYFIETGLASVLNVMPEGKSVEIGLAGKEGFVGLPVLVGFGTSPTRTVMQIGGSGIRVSTPDMIAILRDCPKLEKSLHRYAQEFALQTTQIAACNRLHEVDKRLARWLLASADRVDDSTFPLTQEFLSHMLGTRRASVTVAAGVLQRAGLITYKRGEVKIKDRTALEKAACECYSQLNEQLRHWHDSFR